MANLEQALLDQLQSVIEREIPMCAQMGIQVKDFRDNGLAMQLPLEQNRNHQQTAFAGSLNALCTVVGWGSVYLLLRQHRLPGDIVIRRSSIKYLKPVETPQVVARCLPIDTDQQAHFVEMLQDKGQAKIDLRTEISADRETAVSFHGSYVVLSNE